MSTNQNGAQQPHTVLRPKILHKDGPFGKALLTVSDPPTEFGRLHKSLRQEFEKLRDDKCWKKEFPDNNARKQRLQELLREYLPVDRDNGQILRLLIALHERIPEEKWFYSRPWEQFVARHTEFEYVLGDAIPQVIRDVAADSAYSDNLNSSALEDWPAFVLRLDQIKQHSLPGLKTGLSALDEAILGLRGLTVLAGETGVGKSALALFLAVGVLKQDSATAVLFYSMELSKTEIFMRFTSLMSGTPYRTLLGMKPSELKSVISGVEANGGKQFLSRLRVHEIRQTAYAPPLSEEAIRKQIKECLGLPGIRRILIIIDPIQRLDVYTDLAGPDGETQQRRLTDLEADEERVRMLTRLQKLTHSQEFPEGHPILAISGVRKPDYHRNRLSVSDIRGRADLGYEANTILLLEQRPDAAADADVVPVYLNVAKARDGTKRGDILLDYCHSTSTFRSSESKGTIAAARVPGDQQESLSHRRFSGTTTDRRRKQG
jgi:replicative DNA helicase